VLGSGDVTEVQRVVNDADGFTADNQLQGDADLDALIPGYNTFDAVSLEFDVTPTKSGELVFSWVMFSEEYNEWVSAEQQLTSLCLSFIGGKSCSEQQLSRRLLTSYNSRPNNLTW